MPEFMIVHENIKDLPAKQRQDWIWDKIIYANPTKPTETLEELNPYKPLVTFDNLEEIRKIRKHAPNAGLALRLKVPNTGAMVELSSKFGASPGEAVDLILEADRMGLVVEGISFHVGSQTTNFENYVQALNLTAAVFKEARDRGYTKMNLIDIGGGFPAPYDASVKPFPELAKVINAEIERLFPPDIQILAEPGRFLVASAGYAVSKVIGKAVRDGKACYYINDGVYHTYSGVIFDHCKYPIRAFKKGAHPDQLGLRPDLRRARRRFDGGEPARPGARRFCLQREHRRLQPRLGDLLQRLSPRQGRPRERIGGASAPVVRVLAHVLVGEVAAEDHRRGPALADVDLDLDAPLVGRIMDRGREDSALGRDARVQFGAAQVLGEGLLLVRIEAEDAAAEDLYPAQAKPHRGKVHSGRGGADLLADRLDEPSDIGVVARDRALE